MKININNKNYDLTDKVLLFAISAASGADMYPSEIKSQISDIDNTYQEFEEEGFTHLTKDEFKECLNIALTICNNINDLRKQLKLN